MKKANPIEVVDVDAIPEFDYSSIESGLDRASTAFGAQEWAAVAKELKPIRALLAAAGIESAFVNLQLGIALDYLGHFECAIDLFERAVRLDQGNPNVHHGRATGYFRVRRLVTNTETDDATAVRAYKLLVARGQTEAETHVAMAQRHLRAGRVDAATEITRALSALFPTAKTTRHLEAALRKATGGTDAVADAEPVAAEAASPLPTRPGAN